MRTHVYARERGRPTYKKIWQGHLLFPPVKGGFVIVHETALEIDRVFHDLDKEVVTVEVFTEDASAFPDVA
jgi:hypothetical protein